MTNEIAQLIIKEFEDLTADASPLLKKIIANQIVAAISPTPEAKPQPGLEPMTDGEAWALDDTLSMFPGPNFLLPFRMISRKWLAAKADESRECWALLTRYLRNPKVAAQLERENDCD